VVLLALAGQLDRSLTALLHSVSSSKRSTVLHTTRRASGRASYLFCRARKKRLTRSEEARQSRMRARPSSVASPSSSCASLTLRSLLLLSTMMAADGRAIHSSASSPSSPEEPERQKNRPPIYSRTYRAGFNEKLRRKQQLQQQGQDQADKGEPTPESDNNRNRNKDMARKKDDGKLQRQQQEDRLLQDEVTSTCPTLSPMSPPSSSSSWPFLSFFRQRLAELMPSLSRSAVVVREAVRGGSFRSWFATALRWVVFFRPPVGIVIVVMAFRVFRITLDHVLIFLEGSQDDPLMEGDDLDIVDDAVVADEDYDDDVSVAVGEPEVVKQRRMRRRRNRRRRERIRRKRMRQIGRKSKSDKHEWVFGQMGLELEPNDIAYRESGGVQSIRTRLCKAALEDELQQPQRRHVHGSNNDDKNDAVQSHLLALALRDVMDLSTVNTGFVSVLGQTVIEPLAKLEYIWKHQPVTADVNAPSRTTSLLLLMEQSYWAVHVRVTDVLLRICRNRLLQTSNRLSRTTERRQRRVAALQELLGVRQTLASKGLPIVQYFQKRERELLHQERQRLADVQASCNAEIERLGRIMALLLDAPPDIPEHQLLKALQCNNIEKQKRGHSGGISSHDGDTKASEETKTKRSYSIRFTGRGVFVSQLDDNVVSTSSAVKSLDGSNDDFVAKARDWTARARQLVRTVVEECHRDSLPDSHREEASLDPQYLNALRDTWCRNDWLDRPREDADVDEGSGPSPWEIMLEFLERIPTWSRYGEGKAFRLMSDTPLRDVVYKVDFLAIPSSLFVVYVTNACNAWVEPYWPTLRQHSVEAMQQLLQICRRRVYNPLKGILDDVLGRNIQPRVFSLEDEQIALGNLLLDLEFGDGTIETRREALGMARDQVRTMRSVIISNV